MSKARRSINYTSKSTTKTLAKQAVILRWLRAADEGWSITELATLLGISRQLCLYHVKKLAASHGCVMILEPCDGNGGLRYRVWERSQLVSHFTTYIPQIAEAA